jgi:hypothetical protein
MAEKRRERVALASRRAGVAIVAVAGSTAASAAQALLHLGIEAQTGRTTPAVLLFLGVAGLFTAWVYLRWLHRAVANVTSLGSAMKWRPGQAVSAHFLPIVGFWRPYQVMKALYEASDPTTLPDAPVYRVRDDASYREASREVVAAPEWRRPAPILAWWLTYLLSGVPGIVVSLTVDPRVGAWTSAAGYGAAATLVILVIRSIDARQRERLRRLEASEATR